MLIEELVEYGLSKNEATLYLALLEIGSTTTGPLIKKTGMYRVIVYDTLEKLIRKGLVNYSLKKNRKNFEASPPQQLRELLTTKEHLLNKLIPQLNARQLQKPAVKGISIYEGWKGVRTAQENYFKDMRKGEGEYLMVGASRALHKKLDAYFNYFHERRATLNVPAKLLFNENNRTFGNLKKEYSPVKVRFMPKNMTTPSWFSTYNDMLLIGIAEEEPMAVFIKNESVAQSYRHYFQTLWEHSKP